MADEEDGEGEEGEEKEDSNAIDNGNNQKPQTKDEDEEDEEDEEAKKAEKASNSDEDSDDEDKPPPQHANINGVVWITQKNKQKRKKSSFTHVTETFVVPAPSERQQKFKEAKEKNRSSCGGTGRKWMPGQGKCFVKQKYIPGRATSTLKEVAVERSERAIQQANAEERAVEEAANVAARFNMAPATGGGKRKRNNKRARRR